MKVRDGSFHTKVVVSDERKYISPQSYVRRERFFNIVTSSTGLITFEYGTRFLPHKKEVQRSAWGKDSNLLERLLEKAFNSPRTVRTEGKDPPYVSPGR